MNKLSLIIAFIGISLFSFAQTTEESLREMMKDADENELVIMSSTLMLDEYYYMSEILVDTLLQIKPESSNYNFRKGYLVLNSSQDQVKALPYLEKAIKSVDPKYDMFSAKEESASIEAYYYYAKCKHLNCDIDEAKKYYKKFLETKKKNTQLDEFAELGLAQCEVAEYNFAHPKSAEVKNIGPAVNTDMPEYSPVISLDGTSLYFTSRREWEDKSSNKHKDPIYNHHPEDIYVSFQDYDGEWTEPSKLNFSDPELNEATISISSDERRIFVYQDASGNGDIFFSDFEGNKFDELEKLRFNGVNSDAWETHCTVTPDGENMYFVSDREGGFGGRDIYRIVKLPNGEWSEPLNLGPEINTPFDEDSPFIAVNNKTLYYSSNGPKSMGGFDVFVTYRDEDNVWSTPLNMGSPINSCSDDIYYTTTFDGLKGYLSSFRNGGYGEKDIYEIKNDYLGNRPISSLKGQIIDNSGAVCTNDFKIKVECLNCEIEAEKVTYPRIKNCSYFSVLVRCKEYEITYFQNDSVVGTKRFNTGCNAENEEIIQNYYYGTFGLEITAAEHGTNTMIEDVTVEILDAESGDVLATFNTDENGSVTSSDFLAGKNYGDSVIYDVRLSKEGYLTNTFNARKTLGDSSVLKLDYLLNKSDAGVLIALKPIYFDLNKSNIRPDAKKELDHIVELMNANPELRIEIGSHTDCRSSKSYNMSLSKRRAQSTMKYIRARIKNPKRIYGKGYGESQLVNDCGCEGDVVSDCTEEQHQENRRTEFKIVK